VTLYALVTHHCRSPLLAVELLEELVDGGFELVEVAVESAVAAVLDAGGVGDPSGDRTVGQLDGQLLGEGARDCCGGVDVVTWGGC